MGFNRRRLFQYGTILAPFPADITSIVPAEAALLPLLYCSVDPQRPARADKPMQGLEGGRERAEQDRGRRNMEGMGTME